MTMVESRDVKELLPHAKHKTYVDYGHSVTWEIPEVAAKDIMEFFNSGAYGDQFSNNH